jgi:hypothetical protein
MLRGTALVLAVALSVFGLFQLTFAKPNTPTTTAPPVHPEPQVVVRQQQALVATPSPPQVTAASADAQHPATAVAASNNRTAQATRAAKARRIKGTATRAQAAPRRHDFGF